jgi:hypothetical protein
MACEAKPLVFTYSMRVEWLGLDGQARVNNSMRVEWRGAEFGEHRAVCEEEATPTVAGGRVVSSTVISDSVTHTARCFYHLFVLAALIFVLGRVAGFRVLRVPFGAHSWELDPLVCDWRVIDTSSTPKVRPRRCMSAGAVLQG